MVSTILDTIRSHSQHKKIDFAPSKLKQGFGSEVIWTLTVLVDLAIQKDTKLTQKSVTVKGLATSTEDDVQAGDDEEDEGELEANFDEPLIDDDDDDDSPNKMTGFSGVGSSTFVSSSSSGIMNSTTGKDLRTTASSAIHPQDVFLLSNVDESSWKREVERVFPQLKVDIRSNDPKSDWRLRLSNLHSSRKSMENEIESVKEKLSRLVKEISGNMDKIDTRENYLQSHFEPLLSEYMGLKNQLKTIEDEYQKASSGVAGKSRILSDISDELESIKTEMEERGTAMTDGSPLVSLKKALQKMRSEVTSIDIRIGVATHTILQHYLKESVQQAIHRRVSEVDPSLAGHLF